MPVNINRKHIYFVIIAVFFTELVLSGFPAISSVKPELLLITTIFLASHFGAKWGVGSGALCGFLKDILSVTTFGINTAAFCVIGLLTGALRAKLVRENILTQFFLSGIAVLIYGGIYFLYLETVTETQSFGIFWQMVFCKAFVTALVAPLVFLIFNHIFVSGEYRP